MNWTKGTVNLNYHDGTRPAVDAWLLGNWAVHRESDHYDARWKITHAPSGRGAGSRRFTTLRDAKACVVQANAIWDGTMPAGADLTLATIPEAQRIELTRLMASARL